MADLSSKLSFSWRAALEISFNLSAVAFCWAPWSLPHMYAYQRLTKDWGEIYTHILRLFLLWLPPCQGFSTQFPAPPTALNSVLWYLKSKTQQPSAYFQLLCTFQNREFSQRKCHIKVFPIQWGFLPLISIPFTVSTLLFVTLKFLR